MTIEFIISCISLQIYMQETHFGRYVSLSMVKLCKSNNPYTTAHGQIWTECIKHEHNYFGLNSNIYHYFRTKQLPKLLSSLGHG